MENLSNWIVEKIDLSVPVPRIFEQLLIWPTWEQEFSSAKTNKNENNDLYLNAMKENAYRSSVKRPQGP